MYSFQKISEVLPLYRQENTETSNFPYLLLGLISSLISFILKTVLNYLDKQSYEDTKPPEDILDIIREIDAKVEKEEEGTEKKETLESRVCNSYLKSQLYGKDRCTFKLVKTVFESSVDILTTISGFIPFIYDVSKDIMSVFHWEENEIAVCSMCLILQSLFDTLINIPWNYCNDFMVEEKYGFNNQTTSLFFKDVIKEFFIELVMNVPLYSVLIWLLRKTGPKAYLYCWLIFTFISIVFNMIYPIVIMPLFNTMSPMEDTPLRARIYEIAEKVGFRVGRIQVIDSSERTGHSNAAAYGLFGVNGIIIYDNLLNQLTDDEIIAVICHELGHWKKSHTYRMLLTNTLYTFFMFKSFSFFVFNPNLYASYGFHDTPVVIGLNIFVNSIWSHLSLIANLIMNMFSRKYEYEADEFAARLGYGHHLQVSLTKLEVENSMNFKRHCHPSFAERCSRMNEVEKKMK